MLSYAYATAGKDVVRVTANERIKEVRRTLGLSQAKFAAAISISNGYIAGIELGNRKVNERIVKLIGSSFHVRREWLLFGKGEIFENEPNGRLEKARALFDHLDTEFQEYIIKQIENLLEVQERQKKRAETKP